MGRCELAGGLYINPKALRDLEALGKRFFADLKETPGYRLAEVLAFLNAASKYPSRLDSTLLALTTHQNADWTPRSSHWCLLLPPIDSVLYSKRIWISSFLYLNLLLISGTMFSHQVLALHCEEGWEYISWGNHWRTFFLIFLKKSKISNRAFTLSNFLFLIKT